MSKQERKIKLQRHYSPRAGQSSRIVPSLRLGGIWLEGAGFEVGKTVRVTVKEGELVVKTT